MSSGLARMDAPPGKSYQDSLQGLLNKRTLWALVRQGIHLTQLFAHNSFTATLVEGPNDAVISYNIPAITLSVAENCNIANGIAVCSVDVGGTTDVETETATPFLVQGGTTAIASSPSAVLTPTAAPSSGSTPLISPSQTSSGSAPTQTANGGPKQASSFAAAILGAAGIVLAMS